MTSDTSPVFPTQQQNRSGPPASSVPESPRRKDRGRTPRVSHRTPAGSVGRTRHRRFRTKGRVDYTQGRPVQKCRGSLPCARRERDQPFLLGVCPDATARTHGSRVARVTSTGSGRSSGDPAASGQMCPTRTDGCRGPRRRVLSPSSGEPSTSEVGPEDDTPAFPGRLRRKVPVWADVAPSATHGRHGTLPSTTETCRSLGVAPGRLHCPLVAGSPRGWSSLLVPPVYRNRDGSLSGGTSQ